MERLPSLRRRASLIVYRSTSCRVGKLSNCIRNAGGGSYSAGVADLVAEVSADGGAGGGDRDEQVPEMMLRGHDDDHDVGDARQRQRDE